MPKVNNMTRKLKTPKPTQDPDNLVVLQQVHMKRIKAQETRWRSR